MRPCGINLRAISQKILYISILHFFLDMSLKITNSGLQWSQWVNTQVYSRKCTSKCHLLIISRFVEASSVLTLSVSSPSQPSNSMPGGMESHYVPPPHATHQMRTTPPARFQHPMKPPHRLSEPVLNENGTPWVGFIEIILWWLIYLTLLYPEQYQAAAVNKIFSSGWMTNLLWILHAFIYQFPPIPVRLNLMVT